MSSENPARIRRLIRRGEINQPTPGLAEEYSQANLVILPEEYAFEFFLFSFRNTKPCPLLDILEAGEVNPPSTPGADIRTDLPSYRIYRRGELHEETDSIKDYWRDDLVSFLLGCSFTFERALKQAGIPIRHQQENKNVPMYITDIDCTPAGEFSGPLVVSMRPMPGRLISRAVRITSAYPDVHGAPVHIGAPKEIGIQNLNEPDFGDRVTVKPEEYPVFWACGVTPQLAIRKNALPLVITHSPGHMFITDIKNEELSRDQPASGQFV
ncbi:putative hydro-lyase [Halarsenatibacter silvermanii]|nr:putative hydro-lyase [Halarsenatibacter silvermanii]